LVRDGPLEERQRTKPFRVPRFHRTLSGWLELIVKAGLVIERFGELPIVIALAHRAAEELWAEYGDALQVFGGSKCRAVPVLISMGRGPMLTAAALAGFGRTVSEVGAILIVGGNIAGYTPTKTTAVALETSKGNLPLALGPGLFSSALAVSSVPWLLPLLGRSPR